MRYEKIAAIFILLATLTACGSHFSTQAPNIATDALTEGEDPNGRAYTSFSSPATVQNIKDHILFSDQNKAFANQIESIQASASGTALAITIQWSNIKAPLIFKGQISSVTTGYSSLLRETSGQKTDLQIKADCETLKCDNLNGFLRDQVGDMIGIIVRREDRVITLAEAPSQRGDTKLLPKDKQDLFTEAEKGLNVSLNSFEVYPGRSHYQIRRGNDLLEGDLLSLDQGSAATQTQGIFANLGAIELIGNNEGKSEAGAELQFQITNQIKTKKIVSYLTMDTAIPLLSTHLTITSLGTNPLVQQILDDENVPALQDFISKNLIQKPKMSEWGYQLLAYLQCEEGDKKNCKVDRQGRDKTQIAKMINQDLHQDGLPAAFGLISYMESSFEAQARSSNALGYWQFIDSTARAMGLMPNGKDLRTDLSASTHAAAQYFKQLLHQWNGDLKMAIISYNMGPDGAEKACKKDSENKANCDVYKNEKADQQKQISDLYDVNRKDFWRLYNLGSFAATSRYGAAGQQYAIHFLGESVVSFHPQHYGYNHKAVDLN